MTELDKAIREITELRKTLMECSHVLNHTINSPRVGDQLKEKIRRHLARKGVDIAPRTANLTPLI